MQHDWRMRIPGGNHLDRQRQLLPLDYLAVPEQFGDRPDAEFVLPTDGDAVSMRLAIVQHRVVCRWRERRQQGHAWSGAQLAREFGCSRQTISASATGHRWACAVVYAAWITTLWLHDPERP